MRVRGKRIVAAAVIFVMLGMIFSGCAKQQTPQKEVLRVLVSEDLMPMSFKNSKNELVGFDIDLAEEMAKILNRSVVVSVINNSTWTNQLANNQADVVLNGVIPNQAQLKNLITLKPYMQSRFVFIASPGGDVQSSAQLEGKKIGVVTGSIASQVFPSNELAAKIAELVTYPSSAAALEALRQGTVSALVCDEIFAKYESYKNASLYVILPETFGTRDLNFYVSSKNKDLATKLNSALDLLVQEESATQVSINWFGEDLIYRPQPTPSQPDQQTPVSSAAAQ